MNNLYSRHRFLLSLIIPCLAVFIAYSPLYFKGALISDDVTFLTQWPLLQNLGNFSKILKGALPPNHEGGYRPLRTLHEAISLYFWGSNPIPYHIQGILFHIFTTGLVFILLLKMLEIFHFETQKKYLFASLGSIFFGLHPILTESVAFIQASFDTMGITYALISYYFFLQMLVTPRKVFYGVFSCLFALIAFLFYELAYPFPAIVAITTFLFFSQSHTLKKSIKGASLYSIPFFIVLGGVLVLRSLVLDLAISRPTLSPGRYYTLLTSTRSLFYYIQQTIFPISLSLIHEVASGITTSGSESGAFYKLSVFHPHTLLSISISGALFFVAWKFYKKIPILTLGISWYFLALSPVMNIFFHSTTYAERYLYFSIIGYILILLVIISKVLSIKVINQKIVFGVILLILSGYLLRTITRAYDWTDSIIFWSKEVNKLPHIGRIHGDLGFAYSEHGNITEALKELQKDIELNQMDDIGYHNLGIILSKQGKYSEARKMAERAVLIKPGSDVYFANLQNIFLKMNNPREDFVFYSHLIEQKKANSSVYYAHGTVAMKLGEMDTAEKSLRRVLEINPDIIQTYSNLGLVLNTLNKPTEALEILQNGLKKTNDRSQRVKLLYHLAVTYKLLGDLEKAKTTAAEAYNLDKENQPVLELIQELSAL